MQTTGEEEEVGGRKCYVFVLERRPVNSFDSGWAAWHARRWLYCPVSRLVGFRRGTRSSGHNKKPGIPMERTRELYGMKELPRGI